MIDRKVVIYGIQPDEFGSLTPTAFTFDLFGFLGTNLYLQGVSIASANMFDAVFDADSLDTDTPAGVPAISFGQLAGAATGPGSTTIFGRQKLIFADSVDDPNAAQVVGEVAGRLTTDTPAVATQAQVTVTAGANEVVRVTGFGFTVTAVAAIAAALQVTLVEDHAGTPVTRWSGRYLAPAGTSKEVWIPGPFAMNISARLTVTAPGATNFVTASIAAISTGGDPT